MERRLVALLTADMVGFSRLMEADEAGTLARQKRHLDDLIAPAIAAHEGEIVKRTGDGLIVIFPSVIEAMTSAVQVQREMGRREADIPETERIQYRVAIHLGDVLFDDDDVYGDGVNIAARLEALADPGGILVSSMAHDHLKSNIDVGYKDLGPQNLKNISTPVRAYKVLLDEPIEAPAQIRSPTRRWLAATVALLGLTILLVWQLAPRYFQPTQALTLPDGPSLAVLPFETMGDEMHQSYLAQGFSEDLITDLSILRDLLVIAPNSSFTYADGDADLRDIGRELGVASILKGNFRTIGDRLRINAQLIDAATGDHIWAERFDVPFDDILVVQDKVLGRIVNELNVKLNEGEQARLWRRSTDDPEAYKWFLRGQEAKAELSEDGARRAVDLYDQALARDPDFTAALIGQGWSYWILTQYQNAPDDALEQAHELARRALLSDPEYGEAYTLLGEVLVVKGDMDGTEAASAKGAALAPGNAQVLAVRSIQLSETGRAKEGLAMIQRAMRLNPHPPAWYLNALGIAHLHNGRYEEAIDAYERCIARRPDFIVCQTYLIAAELEAGRLEEARDAAKALLRLNPEYTIEKSFWVITAPTETERQRRIDLLRDAGVPG